MSQHEIKDLKSEWAERPGKKTVGKQSIRVVSTETEYGNPEKTNVFSIFLNLDSSTTAKKEKSSVVEEGESKKKGKDSQL